MKIMVCHDGSERSQVALEKAIALFSCEKPEIILLTVVEEPADASSHDEEVFEEWRVKREADLKKAAEWVVKQGFDVDAVTAIGDPRKMIVEAANKKNPAVLVVAKRGAGGLEDMVLGSVSAFLIRHAKCPVLIIH